MNLLTFIFLIFVVLLILPAYAQEISTSDSEIINSNSSLNDIVKSLSKIQDLIKQQTITIEDSSYLSENFENIRLQTTIIAGIEASLIGALVALIGQNAIMRKLEIKKINKTKDLILDDIVRIYRNVNQILLEIEVLRSTLQTSNTIQQQIIQNGGIVGENIARILVNSRLLHWNAIVSSGYLIKLNTDAIRSLQSLNNFLEETRKNSLNAYNQHTDNIVQLVSISSANSNIIVDTTTQLKNLAEYFHLVYPMIIKKLYGIEKEVEWIQLNPKIIKKKLMKK